MLLNVVTSTIVHSLHLCKDVLLQGMLYQSTFRFKAIMSMKPARIVHWSQLRHGSFSGSPKHSFFYLILDWWLTRHWLFPFFSLLTTWNLHKTPRDAQQCIFTLDFGGVWQRKNSSRKLFKFKIMSPLLTTDFKIIFFDLSNSHK